ncbi:IS110 family transposase [Synechococcus sp. PCC 7336]|uniref:IS110 family transposase n=1 Tax=Synechococcus sp. PCC 7336 TaxID=195250 RepID=UPI0006846BC0|nr:IS110 family transposase [Synechococcus sp. PCC 7336]
MSETVLGIDVSKAKLQVCLLTPDSKVYSHSFDNTISGHQTLLDWLEQADAGKVHACLESTGNYGKAIAHTLWERDHRISIVNPNRIKGFGASLMQRTKTDAMDALTIARFCATLKPELWAPPTAEIEQLQELMRRLSAVEAMQQQESNRLVQSVTLWSSNLSSAISTIWRPKSSI